MKLCNTNNYIVPKVSDIGYLAKWTFLGRSLITLLTSKKRTVCNTSGEISSILAMLSVVYQSVYPSSHHTKVLLLLWISSIIECSPFFTEILHLAQKVGGISESTTRMSFLLVKLSNANIKASSVISGISSKWYTRWHAHVNKQMDIFSQSPVFIIAYFAYPDLSCCQF